MTLQSTSSEGWPQNIVLYDGDCAFCNASVLRLLKMDTGRQLSYASQQGERARKLCEEGVVTREQLKDLSTILFVERLDGEVRVTARSTAAVRIFGAVGGLWSVGQVLVVVPAFIRDGVYNWIARNRYRWFGKHEGDICRLLTPEEKACMLD